MADDYTVDELREKVREALSGLKVPNGPMSDLLESFKSEVKEAIRTKEEAEPNFRTRLWRAMVEGGMPQGVLATGLTPEGYIIIKDRQLVSDQELGVPPKQYRLIIVDHGGG